MCGFAGIVGAAAQLPQTAGAMQRLASALRHRGPDDAGSWSESGVSLTHRRLSIVDLSAAGRQPLIRGPFTLVYNGEIYNHEELRRQLESRGHVFESRCDTEVVLAAYQEWGESCLERFIGMFAFALWQSDDGHRSLLLARDRFGVKPLYFAVLADDELACRSGGGSLAFASEIAALQAIGLGTEPELESWARFLADGIVERGETTFWRGIEKLGAGETLRWRSGKHSKRRWYDLAERTAELDPRSRAAVREETAALLADCVRLRFRADVPVGVNLSGGLDSSLLLGLIRRSGIDAGRVRAFTFATGDANYDELPWVEAMVRHTGHPHHTVLLQPSSVPRLAERVAAAQSEPAGGLPTLAYAELFRQAGEAGTKVLLDGQGVDEAWAGYDYYRRNAAPSGLGPEGGAPLQGSRSAATRADVVLPELLEQLPALEAPPPGATALQAQQLFDVQHHKLPRALRYNDRVSMLSSVELREPFLDHRLVELGLRQPDHHKVSATTGKTLLREIAADLLPRPVNAAPKRPVQTPQREWLRGPLREWAAGLVAEAAAHDWINGPAMQHHWRQFAEGRGDNSFFVWQWIDLALLLRAPVGRRAAARSVIA